MENNEGHRLVTSKSSKLISLQESIMASSTYPLPTFHYCCASSHLSPWHRITWILLDRFSSVGRMKFFSVQAAMHFYALHCTFFSTLWITLAFLLRIYLTVFTAIMEVLVNIGIWQRGKGEIFKKKCGNTLVDPPTIVRIKDCSSFLHGAPRIWKALLTGLHVRSIDVLYNRGLCEIFRNSAISSTLLF